MDENLNKTGEQFFDMPESADVEQPKLREISEDKLKQILEDHQKWLESERQEGVVANLSGAYLNKANLSRENLRQADLRGTYLGGAHLSGADFRGARLNKAILNGADLSGANLSGAYLNKANLLGANLSEANLSGADLSRANLSMNLRKEGLFKANLNKANLSRTKLRQADLSGADLSGANLSRAYLPQADLSGVNLSGANLMRAYVSGAIVNEKTETKMISGCKIGINGIYCKDSDSAALMILTPPGDSMQGPNNSESIIGSLMRSRRLHGYSLALVGIVLLIAVLHLSEIEFPWAKGIKITPDRFCLLAMPISIGLLILVNSFLSDALRGARYINNRQSAMSVGNFPWAISRYAGARLLNKIISFPIRFIMSFHPLVYIYFLDKWKTISLLSQTKSISFTVFLIFSFFTCLVSLWTFLISQQFQKPILFDRRTEERRKDNIEKLTEVVKEQTSVMKELVDILQPKGDENSKNSDSNDEASDGPENKL